MTDDKGGFVENLGIENLWKHVLADLELSVSRPTYESYVKKMRLLKAEKTSQGHAVTLACQTAFHQMEVEKKLLGVVEESFNRVTGGVTKLLLVVDAGVIEEKSESSPLFVDNEKNREKDLIRELQRVGLKKDLSLKSFAVSSSNEMAYAAAKAVSRNPGKAYNPLFLYGGVGVGKTHLMQGVGQAIFEKNLETRLIYCSGEEFTNEIIDAIRQKSTPKFRRRYRSVELLLIDDIQFIAGKTAVQEEFFHTFNAITNEGGQVILTSDKPPKEIGGLEDRLRSRFEGGLAIDIGRPDFELRSAILMIKSKQLGVGLPTEVAQVIASYETDARALLGALMRVIAMSKTRKRPIDTDMAKEVMKSMEQDKDQESRTEISPEKIVERVANYFSADLEEVLGVKRYKSLTLPRHVAMYLLKIDSGLGLVEIGRFFSGRDHTSVMHAVGKIEKLIRVDKDFGGEMERVRREAYK